MAEDSGIEIRKTEKFTVDFGGISHNFDTEAEAEAFVYGINCARNLPPRFTVKEMVDGVPVWEENKPELYDSTVPGGGEVEEVKPEVREDYKKFRSSGANESWNTV